MRTQLFLATNTLRFSLTNFPISSPRVEQIRNETLRPASSSSFKKTLIKNRATYLQLDPLNDVESMSLFAGAKQMYRGFDRRLILCKKAELALSRRLSGIRCSQGLKVETLGSYVWSKPRAKTSWWVLAAPLAISAPWARLQRLVSTEVKFSIVHHELSFSSQSLNPLAKPTNLRKPKADAHLNDKSTLGLGSEEFPGAMFLARSCRAPGAVLRRNSNTHSGFLLNIAGDYSFYDQVYYHSQRPSQLRRVLLGGDAYDSAAVSVVYTNSYISSARTYADNTLRTAPKLLSTPQCEHVKPVARLCELGIWFLLFYGRAKKKTP